MEKAQSQSPSTHSGAGGRTNNIVKSPEWQAAKNKAQQLYYGYPGFSGVGSFVSEKVVAILLLFFDTIPDDAPIEIDGIPILAKKWF